MSTNSLRVWMRRSDALVLAYSDLQCSASRSLTLSNSSCTMADSGNNFNVIIFEGQISVFFATDGTDHTDAYLIFKGKIASNCPIWGIKPQFFLRVIRAIRGNPHFLRI